MPLYFYASKAPIWQRETHISMALKGGALPYSSIFPKAKHSHHQRLEMNELHQRE